MHTPYSSDTITPLRPSYLSDPPPKNEWMNEWMALCPFNMYSYTHHACHSWPYSKAYEWECHQLHIFIKPWQGSWIDLNHGTLILQFALLWMEYLWSSANYDIGQIFHLYSPPWPKECHIDVHVLEVFTSFDMQQLPKSQLDQIMWHHLVFVQLAISAHICHLVVGKCTNLPQTTVWHENAMLYVLSYLFLVMPIMQKTDHKYFN